MRSEGRSGGKVGDPCDAAAISALREALLDGAAQAGVTAVDWGDAIALSHRDGCDDFWIALTPDAAASPAETARAILSEFDQLDRDRDRFLLALRRLAAARGIALWPHQTGPWAVNLPSGVSTSIDVGFELSIRILRSGPCRAFLCTIAGLVVTEPARMSAMVGADSAGGIEPPSSTGEGRWWTSDLLDLGVPIPPHWEAAAERWLASTAPLPAAFVGAKMEAIDPLPAECASAMPEVSSPRAESPSSEERELADLGMTDALAGFRADIEAHNVQHDLLGFFLPGRDDWIDRDWMIEHCREDLRRGEDLHVDEHVALLLLGVDEHRNRAVRCIDEWAEIGGYDPGGIAELAYVLYPHAAGARYLVEENCYDAIAAARCGFLPARRQVRLDVATALRAVRKDLVANADRQDRWLKRGENAHRLFQSIGEIGPVDLALYVNAEELAMVHESCGRAVGWIIANEVPDGRYVADDLIACIRALGARELAFRLLAHEPYLAYAVAARGDCLCVWSEWMPEEPAVQSLCARAALRVDLCTAVAWRRCRSRIGGAGNLAEHSR